NFEVLEGTLTAKVGGEQRQLGRGETLQIGPGTPHQIWNAAEQPVRATWQTRPRLRTEEWFRAIDGLLRSDRVDEGKMPGPLVMGAYVSEYGDVFRLAGPQLFVRPAVEILGVIGRARGFRP